MAKRQTIENLDLLIARWQTRLKRAVNAIDKLEKQRKRLVKAGRASLPYYPTVDSETTLGTVPPIPRPTPIKGPADIMPEQFMTIDKDANLDIPEFLRRPKKPDHDMIVAEQIRLEQETTKRLKSKGRIEKMKAKKAGDLKKMPLTGKAALAAIRG